MLCMLMYMFLIRTDILFWSVWCSDLESAFPRELIGHSVPYAWLQNCLKSHALSPKQRYLNFPYYPRRMLRYHKSDSEPSIQPIRFSNNGNNLMNTELQRLISLSPFPLFLFPSSSVPCLYLISPLGGDPNETDWILLVDLEMSCQALICSVYLLNPNWPHRLFAPGSVWGGEAWTYLWSCDGSGHVKWRLGGRFDQI